MIRRLHPQMVLVVVLVGCVLLAGCAGWGGDGATDDDDIGEDEGDDLEEIDDEADDETDEPDDADASPEEGDDADDASEEDEEEYASPDDVEVEGVSHMETTTDHDEITLVNTNDELALSIQGWQIELDGQEDERITVDEEIVIEPDESYTYQFPEGEKVLNEDGGVIDLYDAEGDHVGSWDHLGSPSAPPEGGDEDEIGYVQFEVIDAATSNGVGNAEVTLSNGDGELTGSTDGAGVTTIREIPYGEYEVTIVHDEYADYSATITVDAEALEMTIELDPNGESATQLELTGSGSPASVDSAAGVS